MLQNELKKLNKYKLLTWLSSIVFIILCSAVFIRILMIIDERTSVKLIIICYLAAFLVPIFVFKLFWAKTEEIVVPYVLSKFPNWKLIISRKDKINASKQCPANIMPFKKILDSMVIPSTYRGTMYITDAFQNEDGKQQIIQINYENEGSRKPPFNATLIVAETEKTVKSITGFKNNCYPHGTPDKIMREKSNSDLPKIELPSAEEAKLDVYGNNEDICKKLATQELFSTIHSLQEQLKLPYIKTIFYKKYVIFILRHKRKDWQTYETFFIKLPVFTGVKPQLMEEGVANFSLLTDLANKAQEFTKNI